MGGTRDPSEKLKEVDGILKRIAGGIVVGLLDLGNTV